MKIGKLGSKGSSRKAAHCESSTSRFGNLASTATRYSGTVFRTGSSTGSTMILNRSGIHRGRDDNIDHAIKPMKLAYRSDIDGLRAVAVLLVVFYHNFPASVHGGFIGVDVFFVISGFLITSIVCQALSENKFSFLDFYRRRINRIFPALLVVLTACTIAGWFLLFPVDYRDAGKAIGFGAAFLSNIALLYDTGYFAAPAQL